MITQIDNLKNESGIYCVIHRDSGLCYVGSSLNMHRRRLDHIRSSKKESRNYFAKCLHAFGVAEFDFEVLQYCEKDELLARELFWMRFFNAASYYGMNTQRNPVALYDRKVSPQSRARISRGNKGRKLSPEHAEQLRQYAIGRKKSPETIAKTKATVALNPPSAEARYRMGSGRRGKKLPAHITEAIRKANTGKVKSPETIEKWRKSREGYTPSAETRAKVGNTHRGRKCSEETKELMSRVRTGEKRSDETKEKMRQAKLGKKRSPESILKCQETWRLKREAKQSNLPS